MQQGMRRLLEEVASDAPTPGGGSVSALSGALAAALAAMVWRLSLEKQAAALGRQDSGGRETVGPSGAERGEASLEALIAECDRLREKLAAGFEEDAQSYQGVLAAFRMPKLRDEEKATRRAAIESAMQQATLVPLQNARLCLRTLELATEAAGRGYQPSVTDAGVGALLGHAGVLGCLYNVELNLQSVKDEDFAARVREEAAGLRAAADERWGSADRQVVARIAE